MKSFIFSVAFLFLTTPFAYSQANTEVSGTVIDSKNAPIDAANISMVRATDSTLVKMAISDKQGRFYFSAIPYGNYFVTVTTVNSIPVHSKCFQITVESSQILLGTIQMEIQSKNLNAVVVTGKKQVVEQKIDRLVINVDASVTNTGATALEVLEKSPGVSIDKDGNISLKGMPQVLIMIDGKPTYLSGTELTNMLVNMNASQLTQIEIMSNPSAKYDAAGNAGVINIKTKKSLTQGFNGSIILGYGQGVYPKSNNSLMLNYRSGKINAILNFGYNLNNGFMDFNIQRNFYDNNGMKSFELDQLSNRINKTHNTNLKLGLDYYISPNTTLGFVTSGFIAPQGQNGNTSSYLKDAAGEVLSIEKTIRTVDNAWKNGAVNINFHTVPGINRDLSANFDYLHYDFSGNQLINGNTYNSDMVLQSTNIVKNLLPLKIDIYSGRLDYMQTLKNDIHFEAGIKSSLVKTSNTSDYFNLVNNQWQPDSLFSSTFVYSENINAAYVNLNKKFGKWMVQAGLRFENTNYQGVQSAVNKENDSSFSRLYNNLFPTAFVSYEMNDNNQIALTFGKRIDRPVYTQLNPFISFLDKYTYSSGNPFLQPQYGTNIELSHLYKNILTTTLNYTVIHDMINETLIHQDSVIIRSVGNIGTRYNFGISESATIPFTRWYTGIFFVNLFQNKYDGAIDGNSFEASQMTVAFNINNQFSFKGGWAAELSGNYTSQSRDEGQAIVLPIGQVSAGISKSLLKNKASIKLNVRDIFYTNTPKEIQNFQDVQSTLSIKRDSRVFNIAFVYRFGITAKPKQANAKPNDEQERVKLN
jgi:iron complex outermembrane recepter protein